MQTTESCMSMGLGGLPPGSYAQTTKQATGKTERQDINPGYYYVDDDNDDVFVSSLQKDNELLRQQMVEIKMQLAGALGKIDELTQINRHLAFDRNVIHKFESSPKAAASITTGTSTCNSFATATTNDVPSLESSATWRSQGRKELPPKTHQEQTAESSSSSVATHVRRQSFRFGGSMSVQSVLTSLRGEAHIACIESQQRRYTSSYYSRYTGSQSSLSTSGLSSINDVCETHNINNSSQSLCDDLYDEDDNTYHGIPTPPSSTHRQYIGTQTNSLLERLSTTLPSLLRGESGDSLATDRER